MNTSNRIKIWILISHACIIIGMGHGVITLGIAEIFWLKDIGSAIHVSGDENQVSELTLRIVAICCLLGQVPMIWSMVSKDKALARWLHILGIGILWTSILTYGYGIRRDNYAHLSTLTCVPFLWLTFWSLTGPRIRKWIRNKEWPEAD